MTVGEIAAICGIPSALTVAIVGFFVWLLQRSISKREKARAAEDAKLEAERVKQENSRKAFEKNLLATSNAALALGEATARAVQRIPDAHCNGDMHAALDYAAEIKHKHKDFITEQGVQALY